MRARLPLLAVTVLTIGAAPALPDDKLTVGSGCFYDIVLAADQTGRICHTSEDAEFRAAVADSLARLDQAFVAKGIPAADLARIKAQGTSMAAAAPSCNGDADKLYQMMRTAGAAKLRADTDQIIARPGKPTYGDCF